MLMYHARVKSSRTGPMTSQDTPERELQRLWTQMGVHLTRNSKIHIVQKRYELGRQTIGSAYQTSGSRSWKEEQEQEEEGEEEEEEEEEKEVRQLMSLLEDKQSIEIHWMLLGS